MKAGWDSKRLADLVLIKPPKREVRGIMPDTSPVSFLPMEDLRVFDREILPSKERRLSDVIGGYTYFRDDDVLIAKITPCFENGKMGIAKNLRNGIGFGSSEYIVIRCNGEIIPEYLYYFFSMSTFRSEGSEVMTGAVGHKRVPIDFVENYQVPFPISITEQRRIVSTLDKLFLAIEKSKSIATRRIESLDELKDSILSTAFTGGLGK